MLFALRVIRREEREMNSQRAERRTPAAQPREHGRRQADEGGRRDRDRFSNELPEDEEDEEDEQ